MPGPVGGPAQLKVFRPGQAGHEPLLHGIIQTDGHDNRYRPRGQLRRPNRNIWSRDDDVNSETDKLSGKLGESFGSPICASKLDDEILTLDVAQFSEALPEGLAKMRGCRGRDDKKVTYPRQAVFRLRFSGERRGDEKSENKQDPTHGNS